MSVLYASQIIWTEHLEQENETKRPLLLVLKNVISFTVICIFPQQVTLAPIAEYKFEEQSRLFIFT